jgi:hypothetical protein
MHSSLVLSHVARVITTVVILLLARAGFANEGSRQPVPCDAPGAKHQLWLINTRYASSCPSLEQTSCLRYWRCDPDYQWRDSSVNEVLASDDPDTTTLIYVHENRVSEAESFHRAVKVFQQLSEFAPPEKRFRLIAVSWPSARIGHRQRPDVQIKSQRSEAHGFYLAWLVDQIHPDVPISFFGNSYGPRMITAALHCLAGGSIRGQYLSQRVNPTRRPVRAVFMAAALDAHWLSPGQRYGLALTQVEHMLVTVNPTDESLRWYPRMYTLSPKGANALGYVGVPRRCLGGQNAGKVVQWNVSCIVGRTHSWKVYEGSSRIMQQIAPHLFGA